MSKSLMWRWIAIVLVMVAWGFSIPPIEDGKVMDVFKELAFKNVQRLRKASVGDSEEAKAALIKVEAYDELLLRAKALIDRNKAENDGKATLTAGEALRTAARDEVGWRGAQLKDYISVRGSTDPSNKDVVGYVRRRARGNLHLGLDLQGGTEFVISFNPDEVDLGNRSVAEMRDQILEILRNRIDVLGVLEPELKALTDNTISLRVPTVGPSQKAVYRKLIQISAKIEFYLVDPQSAEKFKEYEEGKSDFEPSPGYQARPHVIDSEKDGKTVYERVFLKERPERIRGQDVKNASAGPNNMGNWEITLSFRGNGTGDFARVTTANVGQRLAIVMDRTVYSAPNIKDAITTGKAVITGSFTSHEARRLAGVISAGNLPVKIKIDSEFGTDPTLGADSIRSGFFAALGGLVLVVIFMIFYYRIAGAIAIAALACNMILVLGTMALFGATLTLPGIAGIVLTIGMAVDANVLIFERIREEMANGKTVGNAIKAGYGRAFVTILDSNLTTLLTALILYKVGTGQIKGFAVTLSVGILASMFTALFMTRAIFDLCLYRGMTKLSMWAFPGVTNCNYRFLSYKKFTAILSGALIGISVIVFIGRMWTGSALGVDLTGGIEVAYQATSGTEPTVTEVRNFLKGQGITGARVGYKSSPLQTGKKQLELTFKSKASDAEEEDAGTSDQITDDLTVGGLGKKLNEAFPSAGFLEVRNSTVGSLVGEQFRDHAVFAAILAIIGIVGYISFRFEFAYAVASVVALLHDVIIAAGIYMLMPGRELSLPVVAALLTIIGYSLNDTIVVFDRIREDLGLRRQGSYTEIVNISINQTLSRTVLTSLTTAFVVLTLLLFGGGAINDFALVMFIGVIVGTYSSIFVASSIISTWHKSSKRHANETAKAVEAVPEEAGV
ncbi:MAG: protein translocase subunit SecD [Victivallales bacterium]|nr:protein translocase subunit SecD [Victivallales bacterium]MBT7166930.1 protein translocase subunit SecD [Victivallales bacterium]